MPVRSLRVGFQLVVWLREYIGRRNREGRHQPCRVAVAAEQRAHRPQTTASPPPCPPTPGTTFGVQCQGCMHQRRSKRHACGPEAGTWPSADPCQRNGMWPIGERCAQHRRRERVRWCEVTARPKAKQRPRSATAGAPCREVSLTRCSGVSVLVTNKASRTWSRSCASSRRGSQ
jgi:hypothetical protein